MTNPEEESSPQTTQADEDLDKSKETLEDLDADEDAADAVKGGPFRSTGAC